MGLLEKLRPQPKWKHGDPGVRLEGVHEVDETEQDLLVGLAKDDPDARVRRAAASRLTDASELAGLVRNEAHEEVREAALARLAARAAGADEAAAVAAVDALAALARQRELATVARLEGLEAVRRRAVEHVSDPKGLGGIARHAATAGTRLLALERLTDPAVAAVDRLSAPTEAQLDGIAQRARTKAAQKRARALMRRQDAAVAPVDPPAVQYREADEARALGLGAQMEALPTTPDVARMREAYAAARVAWVELLADADVRPEIVERFERLSDVVRGRLAADEADRRAAEQRAEARAREQAGRAAVCAEVESLAAGDIAGRLEQARATWAGMPPMPEEWAGELQRRFDEACRAAERRHERQARLQELIAKLPELVSQVEGFAAAQEYGAIRAEWLTLRRQWQSLQGDVEIDAELRGRYEQAAARLEASEHDAREERLKHQQDNLHRLQALVQALETKAAGEQLTLREAEHILKEVKLAVGTMGPLPTKQDREDLTVRLHAVRAALQPRLQEMREAEEWKRWANVQIQEELAAKMEALIPIADAEPDKAATEMRLLQERWKPVAAAPRSQAEALWTRFKSAQEQVYEKCKDYFAQQAAERQENLKKKDALSARAEALADSTDWVRTAEAIKALQAEWKSIGPVTRGHEKAIWERFRAACDHFFRRRQEDLKQRKHDWSENLRRKEALIAEAEQLAQSTEWDRAGSRIKQLQLEWKKIGPVRKNKSEAVWQRFRGACDTFFERFKTRDQVAFAGKIADRETAVAEIEALVPPADAPPDAAMPEDLYARVQAARARWLQGPELPRHTLAPLTDRVNQAMLALAERWPAAFSGTELNPDATLKKMEKLVAKVEALLPPDSKEPAANLSPAEMLARQWREALAANTMGAGAARQAEEARQRAAEQEVRSAQAAWLRLGPVDPEVRKTLQDRFDRAVRRFFEQKRRHLARA
jgi:hypothetical protein